MGRTTEGYTLGPGGKDGDGFQAGTLRVFERSSQARRNPAAASTDDTWRSSIASHNGWVDHVLLALPR